MAKLCECCGNKNNSFIGDPLYLDDDKILCYLCVGPIRDELNELFYIKTKEEFDALSNSIISKCKELFNDDITNYICLVTNKRCKSLGFTVDAKEPSNIDTTYNSTITTNSNSNGMFSNIGAKIKTLATISTLIGIISCILGGMYVMTIDEDLVFSGFLIMLFGSIISWISSFVLYGFGQLIDNSDKLVQLLKK